jgi:hypothetical protein
MMIVHVVLTQGLIAVVRVAVLPQATAVMIQAVVTRHVQILIVATT